MWMRTVNVERAWRDILRARVRARVTRPIAGIPARVRRG